MYWRSATNCKFNLHQSDALFAAEPVASVYVGPLGHSPEPSDPAETNVWTKQAA
jgi:hypothetical protein